MSLTKFVGLLAFTAVATSATAASVEATNDTNAQIAELKKELNELKSQNGDKWLTEERASQIRGVVQDVMADADTRSSLQATAATSGYNNGFFRFVVHTPGRLILLGMLPRQLIQTQPRLNTEPKFAEPSSASPVTLLIQAGSTK